MVKVFGVKYGQGLVPFALSLPLLCWCCYRFCSAIHPFAVSPLLQMQDCNQGDCNQGESLKGRTLSAGVGGLLWKWSPFGPATKHETFCKMSSQQVRRRGATLSVVVVGVDLRRPEK